jgi:hypothetical protein
MRLLRHIVAKDLRRLRWPLLAWLLIIVVRVAVTAARSELAFDDLSRRFALENLSDLLMLIDALMLVLLVSWLVHDEPLVGTDAFWLTRPIGSTRLMGAKLAFAILFLVAAPALAQSIVAAVAVRSPGHAVRLLPGLLISQSLWVAALIAFATLTPSVTRFLLALVAAAAAGAVAISGLIVLLMMRAEESDYPTPELSDPSSVVPGWSLWLAVAVIVIALQYRTRRPQLAICAGLAGVVSTVVIVTAWPWRSAGLPEPDPGAWARDSAAVTAVLDPGAPYVTDARGMRRRSLVNKLIAVPIRLTGVPSRYAIQSLGVRSRLELAGGSTVQSAQGGSVPVPLEGEQRAPAYLAPVQAVLLPSQLVGWRDESRVAQWPIVLKLPAGEYERVRSTPGRLTATIEAFLRESRLVGSIPLVPGATLNGATIQFELRRVERWPGGCSVLVREIRSTGSRPVFRRSYLYFLRNVQRGEAVLGESEMSFAPSGPSFTGLFFGGWSVESSSGSGLGFLDHVERYPAQSPVNATLPLDAGWFAGADLAVIETAYAGRVSRSIVVDGFTIER